MSRAGSRRSPGEGALFYRADRDRWIGRVTVDGEHRTVSAKSKTEARKELDNLRHCADDGLPLTPRSMSLSDLLTLWTDKALPNRPPSASARTSHRWAVKILMEELGNVKVRRLTPDQVEAALLRRTKKIEDGKRKGRGRTSGAALSRSSLVKIRSTLSQALRWAQRRDLVVRNVATLVEIPTGAGRPEVGQVIDRRRGQGTAAAGTELEAMWVVMLYLGLRPGEAAGLAWDDIDVESGTLDAPQPALDSFARQRKRQNEQRLAAGSWWANEENLVFTSPFGKPCDPTAVHNEFREIIAASDLAALLSTTSSRKTPVECRAASRLRR